MPPSELHEHLFESIQRYLDIARAEWVATKKEQLPHPEALAHLRANVQQLYNEAELQHSRKRRSG